MAAASSTALNLKNSFSSSVSTTRPLLSSRRPFLVPVRRRTQIRAKIREIFMPALSSTMTEGKIVSWVKSEGDRLSKGESVVVVESDKADMDVETFYDGILAAIVVPEGETAPVGAPIGLLAESEEEVALAKAQAAAQSSVQPTKTESKTESVSLPSPPPPSVALPSAPAAPAAQSDGPKKTVVTPYAKKLAKQHKVDIGSIVGTGPYGRITPADVEAAAGIKPEKPAAAPSVAAVAASSSAPAAAKVPAAAPTLPPIPGATIVPFTTMQAAVSKNMVESLSVPTFRVGYPVTTDALDKLYERVSMGFPSSPYPK